jgi:hypothetical protein
MKFYIDRLSTGRFKAFRCSYPEVGYFFIRLVEDLEYLHRSHFSKKYAIAQRIIFLNDFNKI